ncbi:DPP IV N-terminal domain-containing protein, partial [Janibacter hoylei]|uniref:DPP IV N-terminal domain-containing protein n=1 Tax=Janibacter hoylei TaxID=364298 RepID=UPI0024905E8E
MTEPVTSLVGLNEEDGLFFFRAVEGVLTQQIYGASLSGEGGSERVTDLNYTNSASMDPTGRMLLISRSANDQPTQGYLASRKGTRIAWVEE